MSSWLKLKKGLKDYRQKKEQAYLLKAYYRRQDLIKGPGVYFSRQLFLFLAGLLLLFCFAPTLKIVGAGILVLFLMIFLSYRVRSQKEKARLAKACLSKIAMRELQNSLAQAAPEEILKAMQKKLYPGLEHWQMEEGLLWGKELALVYLDSYGEKMIPLREIGALLQKCWQRGVVQLSIFTFAQIPEEIKDLPFPLRLKIYEGEVLGTLCQDTVWWPSLTAIKEIMQEEIRQPQQKLFKLKKVSLYKKKSLGYFLYGCLFFFMVRWGWGFFYLNIMALFYLWGLALVSLCSKG